MIKKIKQLVYDNLDKVAHFSLSCFIFIYLFIILSLIMPFSVAIFFASLIAFSIGFHKEMRDKKFDWNDVIANILGIINAIIIVIFFKHFI